MILERRETVRWTLWLCLSNCLEKGHRLQQWRGNLSRAHSLPEMRKWSWEYGKVKEVGIAGQSIRGKRGTETERELLKSVEGLHQIFSYQYTHVSKTNETRKKKKRNQRPKRTRRKHACSQQSEWTLIIYRASGRILIRILAH